MRLADVMKASEHRYRDDLKMNTWSRHSVLADLTQRSALALARGDLKWRANLGNTTIAHPTMECGAVTAVAVMDGKSWRLRSQALHSTIC